MVKNILFRYIVSVCAIMALSKVAMSSLATDYFRTKQSGNWNDINTWESSADNSIWADATLIPGTPSTKIQIQNGHTVTVSANITVDDVVIEEGGVVDVVSEATLTIANAVAATDFDVLGILRNAGTIITIGNLVFHNNSIYRHTRTSSSGVIPNAVWEDGSSCEIIGFVNASGAIGGMSQSFYNFIWNCPRQLEGFVPSFGNSNPIFRNNFVVMNTGIGSFQISGSGGKVITVDNYIQSGGTVNIINTNDNSKRTTIDVKRDFNMTGGTLRKGINLGIGEIVFSGTTEQIYSRTEGVVSGGIEFIVNPGAIVDFGDSTIPNTVIGTFIVQDGATLLTSHPQGISLSGATGAIQSTGTRTFSPNANYVFNGAAAQQTGTGLPASVNNLTVDNPAEVTLRPGALTVNGTLEVTNGYLDLGSNTLTTTGAIGLMGNGTLKTQHVGTALSSGKTWNGTVEYNGSSPQNIITGQYNNLKLTGGNKTLMGNITVSGDLDATAAGTVNTGTYKVNYNKVGNQNVGGIAYYDLEINGSGTKTVAAAATVSNNVTVNAGILNANGNLTLLASANSNANIGALSGSADVVGNVKIQSFLRGADYGAVRGSRTMSSPVNDAAISGDKTFAQLKKYMIITGNGGAINGFDAVPSGLKNADMVLTYDENAATFVPIPNITSSIGSGYGFIYLFIGNRDYKDSNPGKLIKPFVPAESVMLTYEGPINKGNIDIPVSYNSNNTVLPGAFIAGNPYPATIDWEGIYASSSNLGASISIVFGGKPMASYNAVLGTGVNGGGRYIQPGQGFYIYANNGGGVLRFRESHKNINEQPARLLNIRDKQFLYDGGGKQISLAKTRLNTDLFTPAILRLSLSLGESTEETIVAFDEQFNTEADDQDTPYMATSGYAVGLSTQSSDEKPLAINLTSLNDSATPIKLNINSAKTSEITLNFKSVPIFNDRLLILKDKLNGAEQIVDRDNSQYVFHVDTKDNRSFGGDRLSLSLVPVGVLPVEFAGFDIYKSGNSVQLRWAVVKEEIGYNYIIEKSHEGSVFKELGRISAAGLSSYSYMDTNPYIGNNYYRIRQVDASGEEKISVIRMLKFDFDLKEKTFSIYPNPTDGDIQIKLGDNNSDKVLANIFRIDGTFIKSTILDKGDLKVNIESLPRGVYMMDLIGGDGKRIGTEKIIRK